MSKEYDITVYGQPSLANPTDRTFTIYFNEPECGINKDTGVLLFIAGYGGHANSNVYKKMRSQFADKYNLVTIQCNYFGCEFMQGINPNDPQLRDSLFQQLNNPGTITTQHDSTNSALLYNVPLKESLSNYNDMGPVQAMDHLIALKVVYDILLQNGYSINLKKIIAYGQSHGAYLAHLCNCFMPGAISSIIDNSSYLFPYYLNTKRKLGIINNGHEIVAVFDYLASRIHNDTELFHLPTRYKNINNHANIFAFQGSSDYMTSPEDKLSMLRYIPNSKCAIIDDTVVDGYIFRSTSHGMNADFLHLFDFVYNNYSMESHSDCLQFTNHIMHTQEGTYQISMEDNIPILYKMA